MQGLAVAVEGFVAGAGSDVYDCNCMTVKIEGYVGGYWRQKIWILRPLFTYSRCGCIVFLIGNDENAITVEFVRLGLLVLYAVVDLDAVRYTGSSR